MNLPISMPARLRQAPALCGLLALAWIAASHSAWAATAPLPPVELKPALHYPDGKPGRPTYLRTIKRRFDAASGAIGELQGGWFCSARGNIQWNSKTADTILPTPVMTARFKKLLQQSNFPVPLVSDAVFEEKSTGATDKGRKDELQVGVLVKEITLTACNRSASAWTGEAYVKLFWQVFAPEQQKVVFETTTEGRFQTHDKALEGPLSSVAVEAFVAGSQNLLAEQGFLNAVATPADPLQLAAVGSPKVAGDAAGTAPVLVDGVATVDGDSLSKNITALRSAVATIYGDSGSGRGFFIGRSGWLLTNQHVVGKAKFVKVRLATGRELVGEVRRSDMARDVALVKTEPSGVPPVAIRLGDPAIGEDVYALGSPLGDAFNTTLTRGIVSGMREINAQPFLQSDVAILPGNSGGPLMDTTGQVVGITVMGLGAKGLAGMNFFIPVADALRKLDVKLQGPAAAP